MRGIAGAAATAAGVIAWAAVIQASTLTPPLLPLIVRNPYLSLWLTDARAPPWETWPMFYEKTHIGLSVLAAVAETDTVYPLLGRSHDALDLDGNDGCVVSIMLTEEHPI